MASGTHKCGQSPAPPSMAWLLRRSLPAPASDSVILMGVPTHSMEYSSGSASMKDGGSGLLQIVSPLRQLNGNLPGTRLPWVEAYFAQERARHRLLRGTGLATPEDFAQELMRWVEP